MIQQSIKIQRAYESEGFSIVPLPDPQDVTCYYFRNKSGLFWGELEPYFNITDDTMSLDHKNYWHDWVQHLTNLHMIDLDASNHMMLLSDPKVRETIHSFCERLYSEKGISPQ